METTKESINGKLFLAVDLTPIIQKNRTFYIAKIPAAYFLELYTVKPAVYDFKQHAILASSFQDEEEYFTYLVDQVGIDPGKEDSERDLDKERVKEIVDYLNKKEYAFFPNSIIATCDLINEKLDIAPGTSLQDVLNKEDVQLPYLFESDDKSILYIPFEKDSILILDGQHRLAGIKKADDIDKELDYELLVSFMLKVDRSTRAAMFYTINYNQKPVNRSLLYQLMGEFSKELDEITFMHETVKILNEIEKSPFHQRVKMLGKIPEGTSDAIRERMTISQAFLIDSLERTVSINSIRSPIYPPIFLPYYHKKSERVEIIKFVLKYFQAISRIKAKEWDDPSNYIICNSMGIGAFIRIMHFVFIKLFISEFDNNPAKIKDITVPRLMETLEGIQTIDFKKETYGGASSAGGLNQLVKDITNEMPFLGSMDYDNFLNNHKTNFATPFREWLKNNVDELKETK